MNNLYVIDEDTKEQNRREWSAVSSGGAISGIRRQGLNLLEIETRKTLPATAIGVIFIHTAWCDASLLPKLSEKYPGLILIALNAGGIPDGPSGSKYCCMRKPVGKGQLDTEFRSRVLEFLDDLEKNGKPDFRRLEPDDEPRLAFRLLCEAWLMNKGVPSVVHNDITVNAPSQPEHWFAPFDETQPNDEAAKKIASQMGDASGEVEAFLKRFLGNSANNRTPSEKDIQKLLVKLESASR